MKTKMVFVFFIVIICYSSSLYPAEEDWYIHLGKKGDIGNFVT